LAIDQAFNETVEYYDSWIRKAVPGYDDLFAVAKELIPFTPEQSVDVLDLGAGTGLFAGQVLEKYPLARFVLWDVAGRMLDVASQRFLDRPEQFRYVVDDYRNLRDAGSFDMVVSSLSIHHLEDDEKRELFAVSMTSSGMGACSSISTWSGGLPLFWRISTARTGSKR